jgi:hypothetical protein
LRTGDLVPVEAVLTSMGLVQSGPMGKGQEVNSAADSKAERTIRAVKTALFRRRESFPKKQLLDFVIFIASFFVMSGISPPRIENYGTLETPNRVNSSIFYIIEHF